VVDQAMLHFIYKDELVDDDVLAASSSESSIFDTLAAKLLAASDKYQLDRLRLLCEAYLCKGININSVSTTLALADQYHAMELKAVCLRFAAENLSGIICYLVLSTKLEYIVCSGRRIEFSSDGDRWDLSSCFLGIAVKFILLSEEDEIMCS
jgi:BTB/POZ domain